MFRISELFLPNIPDSHYPSPATFASVKINIAIDGYSSCGKSTLARGLAHALGYLYVDSGAMYRAVTLYLLEHGIDTGNIKAVEAALHNIHISQTSTDGENVTTWLNGRNVEQDIRSMQISAQVSPVSAIPAVRKLLVFQQQQMAAGKGVVMEGRDIGTVVVPDAELKIFLTARTEVRVERRYNEMLNKGKKVTKEEVRKNLAERDLIDSTREMDPLRQAADARVLDNSDLDESETLAITLKWAKAVMAEQLP